ncbi:MAG: DUF885 domain-containing protein, partial [Planctomycetes bacterium]|nr:DUF885 domain-containing protein [Planctomycetota bacterium]
MRPIVAAALALAVVLAGCSAPRQRLARLFDEYWDETMRRNPTWATSLGDHRYDDRLPDLSAEARHEWEGELEDFLGTLRSIPVAKLSAADRLNHRIFERVCEYELSRLLTRSYLVPLNQMGGPHLALPMLQVSHPFETYEDYINYAKRLEAFPDQVEQIVANMEEGRRAGHVAPRVNIVPVITQIESQLVVDPVDSVLFDPLDQVSSALSEDQQQTVRRRVMAAIGECVVPSYRRLLTYLTDTYMPACRNTVGIYDVPGGAAIYVRRTRLETTTDLTPQEIHQIGLAEVTRLRGAMDRVRMAMGFEGELDAFMDHLRSQPEFFAKTGAELVQRCNDCLRRAEAAMPKLFGRLPVASCEMKEIESYRAVSAPVAYYNPPAEDFSRPGYYYINTYEPTKRPLYSLEALTYHEAVPGHHLQIALDQENTSLPRFRRYAGFTAYVEGWALYGESLGAEIGG